MHTHWEFLGAAAPDWIKILLDVFILPAWYFARKAYQKFADMELKLDILIDTLPLKARSAFHEELTRRRAA